MTSERPPNDSDPIRSNRLVFDVTTLARRANIRPTGIDRMILEIASDLAGRAAAVSFTSFDDRVHRFTEVPASGVRAMSDRMRGTTGEVARQKSERRSRLRKAARSAEYRLLRPFPDARPHLRRSGSHLLRAFREAKGLGDAVQSDLRRGLMIPQAEDACFSSEWARSTTYCSVGMDWLHNDLGYVGERKATQGFRVCLMVHDLLPEVTPQYSGVDLRAYFINVLTISDVVVVNSDATAADLRSFAADHDLAVPAVVKLPMGSALRDLDQTEPTLPNGDPIPDRFILCVGTITIRKNHQLLLDVWEQLLAEHGPANTPPLIIVGAKGWLSDETMSRITRTPAFRGIVHHLTNATDEHIAWLYQHCTFTVYPSHYEGWGLPVSESHDFGKVCLTTNTSSLPEAGEGLAELLDPHDRNQWREHIWNYWTNTELRTTREHAITTRHRHITATDAANTIRQLAVESDVRVSYRDETTGLTSVVIAAHNAAEFIGAQLEALSEQVDAPSFEVLVVLNRCTDETGTVARRFLGRLRLRIVEANERASAAYARNLGARESQGDIVLFCDADDRVSSNWVSEMSAALRATGAGMAGSPVFVDRAGLPNWVYEQFYSRFDGAYIDAGDDDVIRPLGGSLGVRRSVFARVGGFDEFLATCEDSDLTERIAASGARLAIARRASVTVSPRTTVRGLIRQQRWYARGTAQLLAKQQRLTKPPARLTELRETGRWIVFLVVRDGRRRPDEIFVRAVTRVARQNARRRQWLIVNSSATSKGSSR